MSMWARGIQRFIVLGALLIIARGRAHAGSTDHEISDDSNEAQIMGYYAGALAFTPVSALAGRPFEAGITTAYLPSLSEEDRQNTFENGKIQNTNLVHAVPRLRLRWRPAEAWLLEGGYFPGVQVNDVTPEMYGLAGAFRFARPGETTTLWVRGLYFEGDIEGPISCSEDAVEDPSNNLCFGGQPSSDHFRPEVIGIEVLASGPRFFTDGLAWYAGAGCTHEDLRFETHFVNDLGRLDNEVLISTLDRPSILGGLTWLPTAALGLSFEGTYEQDAVATVKFGITYVWGHS